MTGSVNASFIELWQQLIKRPVARRALWVLGFLYFIAIAADFLAPYHYADENRDYSYCPPTKIEFIREGHLTRPFVYGRTLSFNEEHKRQYVTDHARQYPIKIFSKRRLFTVDAPGRLYLLGADARGRDLLSRIIYGARISLSIGLIGVTISFGLGLIFGGIAGYFGGICDSALMRLCDMFMLVPGFYLMLALRAAVPSSFNSTQIYISVVVILSLIGWASLARIIRGMCLSLREREYVLAARALGVGHWRIIRRHILPQTFSYSLAAVMISIPGYILAEAGLSLIGLGIQDPIPSWGNLLSEAMGIVQITFAPWIVWPGFFIIVTVVCFNLIGDACRDILEPL